MYRTYYIYIMYNYTRNVLNTQFQVVHYILLRIILLVYIIEPIGFTLSPVVEVSFNNKISPEIKISFKVSFSSTYQCINKPCVV